jgi:hypothetical protein
LINQGKPLLLEARESDHRMRDQVGRCLPPEESKGRSHGWKNLKRSNLREKKLKNQRESDHQMRDQVGRCLPPEKSEDRKGN